MRFRAVLDLDKPGELVVEVLDVQGRVRGRIPCAGELPDLEKPGELLLAEGQRILDATADAVRRYPRRP